MSIDHYASPCLLEAFPQIYELGLIEGERRCREQVLLEVDLGERALGLPSWQRPIEPASVCTFLRSLILDEGIDEAARRAGLTEMGPPEE